MKKKIILYNPKEKTKVRIPHIPFSILTVGSVLKDKYGEKYDIIIIDGRIEQNPEGKIEENVNNCLFFGITCMTGTPILDALKIAKFVRSVNPLIPIVWGGFHPTLLPDITIKNPLVDVVVIGQGESIVEDLVYVFEGRKKLKDVDGIAYKTNGQIFFNKEKKIQDINNFSKIDYTLIDVEKYMKNDAADRTLDYISSRGCPYDCKFCCISSVYERKYYYYPAERVVNEIEFLKNRYKIGGIRFMDDNFFVDKKRVSEICDGFINRQLNIKWWAMCRVDEMLKFSEEFWWKLKAAGLTILNIGAESGSQKILDKISKNITVNMILETAKLCRKYNINAQYSFMAGFPFETDSDFEETLNLMDNLYKINPNVDLGIFIYAPNPGTKLFKECIEDKFVGYNSLEEWGVKCDYYEGMVPWLDNKRREKLKILSYLVWFVFGPSVYRKLKFRDKIFYKILSVDAKIRWKHKFLKFPIEWKIVRKFMGNKF